MTVAKTGCRDELKKERTNERTNERKKKGVLWWVEGEETRRRRGAKTEAV